MGRLADFLAAVDQTTKAGLAMDTATAAAEERALALSETNEGLSAEIAILEEENAVLRAEITRLKAVQVPEPLPAPSGRIVNLWDLKSGHPEPWPTSFFTNPSQVRQVEAGLAFRVRTGEGRSEMGLKDPKLDMVAREPLDVARIYRVRFAVPDGPLLSHKINIFQFWAKSGETPVLACELTKDRLRFVQKITGKIDRTVLLDIPFVRERFYDAEVKALWSGESAAHLGISVGSAVSGDLYGIPIDLGPTTYAGTPVVFKWGAYLPSYMANNEPEPVVGPEVTVVVQRVEVLEP